MCQTELKCIISRSYREDNDLLFGLKIFSSLVVLVFLLVTAVVVLLDSVATVTFRWREYGELTHRHTDATSVLFLLSKSRWKLRLLTCLTLASAASLQSHITTASKFLINQRGLFTQSDVQNHMRTMSKSLVA